MNVVAVVIETLSEFATIIAFVALIGVLVWFFLEKTQAGARFKAMTPWMGWTTEEEIEDLYTNFRIHGANYIPGTGTSR